MGFDAFKDKVNDILGDEQRSDDALDKAADFANEKTGDKFADHVEQGRDMADGKLGEERRG